MLRKKIQNLFILSLYTLSVITLFGFMHSGPLFQRNATKAINNIGIAIAKEEEMTYIGEGMGSSIGANRSPFAVFYTCLKKLTLEEACELAGKAQTTLSNTVYEQPVFKDYYIGMHNYMARGKEEYVNDNTVVTKIAFWDENVDRPLPPYLAEIRVIDGQFLCYYADPKTQALEDPIIRPFHYIKSEPKK